MSFNTALYQVADAVAQITLNARKCNPLNIR